MGDTMGNAMTRAATVGLDFGTGSARALLVDLDSGALVAEHTAAYPRGVLDRHTAPELALAPHWAIQDPADFTAALTALLRQVAATAAAEALELRAIGISATSCTILPTLGDGTPLLHTPAFAGHPHAFARLWKDHSAAPHAERITAAAPGFLRRYNGRTSSEWSLAKAWQTMEEAPRLWEAARRWIDLGDWLVWLLTGAELRSASQAGCKNHWQPDRGGYPDAAALEAVQPGLGSWLDKLAPPHPVGTLAGPLTRRWQELTGIPPTARVAVAMVDAAAAVPGSDVRAPGTLVVTAGTSTCHISLSRDPAEVAGIESTVAGAAVDGFFDHSTGQAATGDMLAWFAGLLAGAGGVPASEVLAGLLREFDPAGDPGPLAVMDWWSGCRTPLGRADLGGSIVNLRTTTTAGDIYRAMLEASAMGMRHALELHRQVAPVHEIRLTGGLAGFPKVMQLCADILGQTIRANPTALGSARGAALTAARGAGREVPAAIGWREFEPRESGRYSRRYEDYLERLRNPPPPEPGPSPEPGRG